MQPNRLEKIKQEGVLHVITRNGPGIYYEDRNGYAGLDYDLVKLFAKDLHVKLRIREAKNLGEIFNVLNNDYTDIAAAGLAVTPLRSARYLHSQAYMRITQVVIYRMGTPRPRNIDDLIGSRLEVMSNSEHSELLAELREDFPLLSWTERDDVETEDLLKMVNDNKIDYTIVDSNVFAIYKAYFPKLLIGFDLVKNQPFAWFYPKSNDLSLYNRAEKFLTRVKSDGTLSRLKERYYGHLNQLNYVGAQTFIRHIKKRLPKYHNFFLEAAKKYNLDWQLLAALSYQESHWKPRAISPTGVRGMMMLTRRTAHEVGIKNRLNPKQSILGGAKYFKKIKSKIPKRIAEPDRTWMALAAYNVGFGHLEDARILAEKAGKNPDVWLNIQKTLPLLQKQKWYKTTKHGYAKGSEPVKYVQNIRRYYDVLQWITATQKDLLLSKKNNVNNSSNKNNQSTTSQTATDTASPGSKLPEALPISPPVL